MCLAQGPQCSDAGEARTRGLSVSEFKVIFDLKSDIIFLVTISLCFKIMFFKWVGRVFWKITHGPKREDYRSYVRINLTLT